MVFNVACTTSIVTVNKKLYSQYHFGFAPTLLLTLHQLTTTAFAFAGKGCRFPGETRPPARVLFILVLSSALSNVLVNLSLKFNSVGTYQLLKMLNIPFTCLGEAFFFGTQFRRGTLVSIATLCVGIALATVNDVQLTATGMLCGCLGPLGGTVNALCLKHVQSEYGASGNALLLLITPWIIGTMVPVIGFTDDLGQLPAWAGQDFCLVGLVLIALSCCIAWALEWTHVKVVELTSALTLQVLGHVKTLLIFTIGFAVFGSPVTPRNVIGMLVAFVSVVAYSYFKSTSAAPVESAAASSLEKSADPPQS